MNRLTTLSNDAFQQIYAVLDDGTVATLEFIYRPALQRWTLNVSHDSITVKNLNICAHPNILRPWRNVIGFGLACTAVDGVDPIDIEDFAGGRCSFFVLNSVDVETVETAIVGAAA